MATAKPVLVLDRDDVLVLLRMLGDAGDGRSFTRDDYARFVRLGGSELIEQLQRIARDDDE